MNKVEMLGRLVKDAELLKSKAGNVYCNFTIAVKRKGSDETDFFDCIAFSKLAETLVKYTEKGNRIIVVGAVQNDKYTDKEGNTNYKTTVKVEDLYFVDFKKELSK